MQAFGANRLAKNISWSVLGNVAYSGSAWLSLAMLAKFTDPNSLGMFALALAVATPISLFFSLNLRVVLVTAPERTHQFSDVLGLQLLSLGVGFAAICAIALAFRDNPAQVVLMLVVGFGQVVVVTKDLFLGVFQRAERMELVAQSKALVGALGFAALWGTLWATRSLVLAVGALQVAKFVVLIGLDVPRVALLSRANGGWLALRPRLRPSRLRTLTTLSAPLGLSSVVASLQANAPKYVIASALGSGALGIYATCMAAVDVGTTVVNAIVTAALPRLRAYYQVSGKQFRKLLMMLAAGGLILGIGGLGVALLWGSTVLEVLFSPQYSTHASLLNVAMTVASVTYLAIVLRYGLLAAGAFRRSTVITSLSFLVVSGASFLLVPQLGLKGAFLSLGVAGLGESALTVSALLNAARTTAPSTVALGVDGQA